MKIKPMLDSYEIPGIERIGTIERRQAAETAVPGLAGSYLADLGAAPVAIVIEGSLGGDEARDGFLSQLRGLYNAGAPVNFVADITTATEVDQVIVAALRTAEIAGSPDSFRYSITLVQYTEPPPPAAAAGYSDLEDLNSELKDEAASLGDIQQLPDTLSLPQFSDPTPPLATMLDGVGSAVKKLPSLGEHLAKLFGASA